MTEEEEHLVKTIEERLIDVEDGLKKTKSPGTTKDGILMIDMLETLQLQFNEFRKQYETNKIEFTELFEKLTNKITEIDKRLKYLERF